MSPFKHGVSPVTHCVSPFTYDVSPVTYGVSPFTYGVSPVTYGVSPFIYDVSPVTYGISPFIYSVSFFTCDISLETSVVAHAPKLLANWPKPHPCLSLVTWGWQLKTSPLRDGIELQPFSYSL